MLIKINTIGMIILDLKVTKGHKRNSFEYNQKEKWLWERLIKKAREGKITLSVALQNFKLFCLTIRSKENYSEWLESNNAYMVYSCSNHYDENIMFIRRSSKPTVRINKRTKEVEFFESLQDLADELCLSLETVRGMIKNNISLDGYTFDYANNIA